MVWIQRIYRSSEYFLEKFTLSKMGEAGQTGYGEITWWSILAVQMRDDGSVLLRCLY